MEQKINNFVKEYIEKNNISQVRNILASLAYMADASTFPDFISNTDYALSQMPDLFECDKEVDIEPRETAYKTAVAKLTKNFSKEKYEKAIALGRTEFSVNGPANSTRSFDTDNKNLKDATFSRSNQNNKTKGIVVLIAVIAVIGLFFRWILNR